MASSLRLWFFLFLVLFSVRAAESRVLIGSLSSKNNGGSLIERAEEILVVSTRRHDMEELSKRYNTNRLSPGGPDPKHH